MGVSTTAGQFAGRINKLKAIPADIGKQTVSLATAKAKANAERSVKAATNGSSRLSNAGSLVRAGESRRVVGRKGATLTVRTDTGDNYGFVSAVGPWQLIESDTKRHFIGAAGLSKAELGIGFERSRSGRNTAKGRLGRSKAVRTPYGLKRYVEVRGTKGKHPWRRAYEQTQGEAPAVLKTATAAEMKKAAQ